MSESFPFTEDDLNLFLAEADELTSALEAALLAVESSTRQGMDPDPEVVADAFRAAHTLKGSSAAVGLRPLSALTHAMETVLDGVRRGRPPGGEEVDLLLRALDHIRARLAVLAEALAAGGPGALAELGNEDDPRADELVRLLGGGPPPPAKAGVAASGAGGVDPRGAAGEAPSGEAGAPSGAGGVAPEGAFGPSAAPASAAASGAGDRLLEVRVKFHDECAMTAVRAYQVVMVLEAAGEILEADPSLEDIEAERVGRDLRVLLETERAAEEIRDRLREIGDVVRVWVGPPGAVDARPPGAAEVRPLGAAEARARGAAGARPSRGAAGAGAAGGAAAAAAAATGAAAAAGRSVRVDVRVLDELMNLAGELVIHRTRLARLIADAGSGDDDLERAVEDIGRVATQLQEQVMKTRMVPLDNLFRRFPRMVRDLAAAVGKEVNLVVRGERTELDRAVMEEIGDPLVHILRNAVDHGLEPPAEREAAGKPRAGTVELEAQHEENYVLISVRDDGRGIDVEKVRARAVALGLVAPEDARRLSEGEVINFIFAPGFSTSDRVTEVSGRGVGLDVVRRNIQRVGGSLEVDSRPGRGTEFRLRLPLTLAIIRCLLCRWGEEIYALPLGHVDEVAAVDPSALPSVYQKKVFMVRGNPVPFLPLGEVLGVEPAPVEFAVVVRGAGRQAALGVTALLGDQEVVVKDLGAWLGNVRGLAGATILGDGRVALILDVAAVVRGRTRAATPAA